jgi:aromatic-L-amino-acid decarboxylase
MDAEEFRRHAHRLVDWMADYMVSVESLPVKSRVAPGEIAAQLPAGAPTQGEAFETIFDDFRRIVMPGITHWQHPNFFAYFPANSSRPSVLAEMLMATLGVNGMLWQTSPAATELETRVMQWLRDMIGLPAGFTGVIQDTASTATLCAILTARERALQGRGNRAGLNGAGAFTTYCSAETHSSIEKDIRIAGLGSENLRSIPIDADFGIRIDLLEQAIAADRAAGRTPLLVTATVGGTANGGFDRVDALADVCERQGLWLHVDAAWAGSAFVLPETRHLMKGCERADSFVFNPHKWLFTNFDCTAYFVRDPQALLDTFAIQRVYFDTAEQGRVIDYRDWGVPLGRRFRALKLWFVIRAYGVEGLQAAIRQHIDAAQAFASWIEASEDFELMAPARLALVVFRYRPEDVDDPAEIDALNTRLLATLNDDGRMYLTPGKTGGRATIRLSVGQTDTRRHHVEQAWELIRETARSLR